jgi:large subunit ribosomal protein L5
MSTTFSTLAKQASAYEKMKADFGYTNVNASPKITKVVISVATGSDMKKDRNRNKLVLDRLTKITGQLPALRKAKKSVASFKLREGEEIGVMVTLRGKRMYSFLDKLFTVSLPRTKDFRGINRSGIDMMGNFTFGIKEHTIFPEIQDEEIKDVFGMAVTLVTTAKNKDEAGAFLDILELPFKKVTDAAGPKAPKAKATYRKK